MSDHAWVSENLAALAADGLAGDERERAERHVHGCGECHKALDELRGFSKLLTGLFADARPAAGFEDRMLKGLRRASFLTPRPETSGWSKWAKVAMGAAALVFLGALGTAVQTVFNQGGLPFPGMEVSNNDSRTRGYFGQMHGKTHHGINFDAEGKSDPFLTIDGDPASKEFDAEINYNVDRLDNQSVPGTVSPNGSSGGKGMPDPMSGHGGPPAGAFYGRSGATRDSSASQSSSQKAEEKTKDASPRLNVTAESLPDLGVIVQKGQGKSVQDGIEELRGLGKVVRDKESEGKESAPSTQTHTFAPPGAGNRSPSADNVKDGIATGGRKGGFGGGGKAGFGVGGPAGGFANPFGGPVGPQPSSQAGAGPAGGGGPGQPGFPGSGFTPGKDMPAIPGATPPPPPQATTPTMGPNVTGSVLTIAPNPATEASYERSTKATGAKDDAPTQNKFFTQSERGTASKGESEETPADPNKKAGGDYYRVPVAEGVRRDDKDSSSAKNTGEQQKEGDKAGDGKLKSDPKAPAKPGEPSAGKGAAPGASAEAPPAQAPAQPPLATQRKIIRTGDIEFEIDVFDNAVVSVTKLVYGVQGGFVATVNSDKLPNGKVRGSIVVRMPPEHLDKFLLDLRKELAKSGELKGQKIGSMDVTKLYYDLESRLKAARTMEERLIDIIKKGKGEIKDLLAAERELGIWRTKIEEMEGEIRYYNNQVGLSTLTIHLEEKEIRIAAAIVVTEHVNMKIEADDVEKGLQTALTAVAEAKGRITKSDLKQHAAGQLEALLQFEVSPAASGIVRDKLKALGVVTHQDSQRLQQAEGGEMKGEVKSRTSDVRFNVTLFNVANIEPRDSYVISLAVVDVPAEYRKLQTEVNKAKGQVRAGKLNENDKLNVTADFSFDVPSPQRDVLDKLIASMGDVLSRSTNRLAPGETGTDRKVGYRLSFRSLNNIEPRESYKIQLATLDVPSAYRDLQDEIAKVQGQIHTGALNESDRLNISADLNFDLPTGERKTLDEFLAKLGDVESRATVRVAPTITATDRRTRYQMTLRNLANIPPRESFGMHLSVTEVAASFRTLQDEVAIAKGRVRTSQLNETDKLNVTAQIDFDVPTEQRKLFDDLLVKMGDVNTRTTNRVAPTERSTERTIGYRLQLRNLASVPARESFSMQIAVPDVRATFRSLQDDVAKAKGQVKGSQLNEQDKLNVTATVDFDVALADRKQFDDLLDKLGDVYVRTTHRIAPNEPATDRKIGYRLTIKSVNSVPPRDIYQLQAVSGDVPETFRKLQEAVAQAKGYVRHANLDEQDKLNVSATFNFDVETTERGAIDKLLETAADVFTKTTNKTLNEAATDRKVGYRLSLLNAASIVPREKVLMIIEVEDLDAAASRFKDIVRATKGSVYDERVEVEPSGRTNGYLNCTVPLAAKDEVIRKSKNVGAIRVVQPTHNAKAPETKLSLAYVGVKLEQRGPIVPSDQGLTPRMRTSLEYSFVALSWSALWIMTGLMVLLPWALLIWAGVKLYRRMRGKRAVVTTAAPAAAG